MLPYPGAVIAGRYELLRSLAEGGMGSVWVARHAGLGTQVAVKFMSFAVSETAGGRARFEREAKAAATLQSPHVVHVIDYGVDEGTPYLVMELLHGEDLAERLRRQRRISVPEASRILTQAAKALRKAHEAGIIHRDLKPNNLFLARTDDDEIVKVLDFGIAKDATASVGESTKTGEFLGSPKYMSPEQVRCEKDIDGRSDVWSLGVILYRSLTGRLPFTAEQPSAILAQIIADPVTPPSQLVPDLPPGIDEFFARALARDRVARFQTVQEMAHALASLVGERAAFPTGAYRLEDATPGSSGPHAWNPVLGTTPMPRPEGMPSGSMWPAPAGVPSTLTTGSGVMPVPPGKEGTSPALLGALTVLGLAVLGLGAFGVNELMGGPSQSASVPELASVPGVATASPSVAVVEAPPPELAPAAAEPVAMPGSPEPTASASAAANASAPLATDKKPTKAVKPAASAKPAATSTSTGSRPAWGF